MPCFPRTTPKGSAGGNGRILRNTLPIFLVFISITAKAFRPDADATPEEVEYLMGRHNFLSIRDFSPEEIHYLLDLASEMKSHPQAHTGALRGKTLAMIFEKPSLRTRVSFDVGIHQLGGFSLYLSNAEIHLGQRESVYDVTKNLERMVQGIMVRTFAHDIVERMAEYASIPIINGLTDYSHPCQAMADYLTMLELKGELAGLKVAFIGDGNNVCHSLMFAGAQLGVNFWAATPPGYEPNPEAVAWARDRAECTGGSVHLTGDPLEAAIDADVIYTDAWASMGQESEADLRRSVFAPYQVNAGLFRRARFDALFMHCLPAHRGDEVTDEVIDSAHSVVYQQAENRLHAQKAILLELMQSREVLEPAPAQYETLLHA
jgi:ornithine carbamoyltransferase